MRHLNIFRQNDLGARILTIAFLAVLAIFASVLAVWFLGSGPVGAVIGGGGSGGTGGGGAHGRNGWGWYIYSVDGSPQPNRFRDGMTWAAASGQCRAAGADKLVAFVLMRSPGDYAANDPSRGVVYEYYRRGGGGLGVNSNLDKDMSVYGGNWLTIDAAYAIFQSLPASERHGWSWGGHADEKNVAWFCYSAQTKWGVNSYSGIKKGVGAGVNIDSGWGTADVNAAPGETMYWKHTLTAKDARIDKRVAWGLRGSGFPGTFALTNNGGSIEASSNVAAGSTFARLGQYPGGAAGYTVYTVTQDDVGDRLCQHIDWEPTAWNVGTASSSDEVCASVPYNYTLTPTVNSSIPETAIAGTELGVVTGVIDNSGPTKSRDDTIWQLTQFIVPAKDAIPGDTAENNGTSSAAAPCSTPPAGDPKYNGNYFGPSGVSCQSLVRSSGSIPTSDIGVTSPTILLDSSLEVGTRVCFALSVRDRSSSDANWQHSEPRCIVISKRPKVQVVGGDLIVGRGYDSSGTKISSNVITSTNTLLTEARTYGSWSQYGIVPSGRVVGMASASGFTGGATSSNLCASLSILSFTNATGSSGVPTCNATDIGGYSIASPSPASAISASFSTTGASVLSGDVNTASLPKNRVYTGNGSQISISSTSPLESGQWLVINAGNSDVRITGNLLYTNGEITDVSSIPQLVIVARNIYIADSVSRIDAWLVAYGSGVNGSINTCDAIAMTNPAANLNSDACAGELIINGPVIANHLYMYRTAGAGPGAQSGNPAEVFNLRPDAHLWFVNYQSSSSKARTVVTSELPPKY